MTKAEQALIEALYRKEISREEFLARFPLNVALHPEYLVQLLRRAYQEQSAEDVDYALLISHLAPGVPVGLTAILGELVVVDWHYSHENIVHWLQGLKDPLSIEPLYQAAIEFPDLHCYGNYTIAVQATYALHDIGTKKAKEKLTLLAGSTIPAIRTAATYQLQRLSS